MKVVEAEVHIQDEDEFFNEIDEIEEVTHCSIQVFDAEYIVGLDHVETALIHAKRSIDQGDTIAQDPSMELLCYAAGRRQINQAMKMGVEEGETSVVIVIFGANENAAKSKIKAKDDIFITPTLEQYDESKVRDFFEVSQREINATTGGLPDIIQERVALLDVRK
ncbi:MAG: KEOPS complex subunit Cgi121 [Halobacteriaceae archaeon]